MTKYIVSYKLHNGQTPYFIEDGGYFPHDGKLVGVTRDSLECYIPIRDSEAGDLEEFDGNVKLEARIASKFPRTGSDMDIPIDAAVKFFKDKKVNDKDVIDEIPSK